MLIRIHKAFNEELDGMYNDLQLPEDEAWEAVTQDLRKTKEAKNQLSLENSQLRRRIAELESQQEE
jgi:protein ECT2